MIWKYLRIRDIASLMCKQKVWYKKTWLAFRKLQDRCPFDVLAYHLPDDHRVWGVIHLRGETEDQERMVKDDDNLVSVIFSVRNTNQTTRVPEWLFVEDDSPAKQPTEIRFPTHTPVPSSGVMFPTQDPLANPK